MSRRASFIPVEGGEPSERLQMFHFQNVGDSVEGRYTEHRDNVGPHAKRVYVLYQPGGAPIGVWGSTVLDSKFQHIPLGSTVYIEYQGEVLSQRGVTYKNYFVGVEVAP